MQKEHPFLRDAKLTNARKAEVMDYIQSRVDAGEIFVMKYLNGWVIQKDDKIYIGNPLAVGGPDTPFNNFRVDKNGAVEISRLVNSRLHGDTPEAPAFVSFQEDKTDKRYFSNGEYNAEANIDKPHDQEWKSYLGV
jgi:hypothetical protein